MDVARSALQGVCSHVDDIYLLPWLGMNKGVRGLWYSELGVHQHSFHPSGQHTLAFYTKCVTLLELICVVCIILEACYDLTNLCPLRNDVRVLSVANSCLVAYSRRRKSF